MLFSQDETVLWLLYAPLSYVNHIMLRLYEVIHVPIGSDMSASTLDLLIRVYCHLKVYNYAEWLAGRNRTHC